MAFAEVQDQQVEELICFLGSIVRGRRVTALAQEQVPRVLIEKPANKVNAEDMCLQYDEMVLSRFLPSCSR